MSEEKLTEQSKPKEEREQLQQRINALRQVESKHRSGALLSGLVGSALTGSGITLEVINDTKGALVVGAISAVAWFNVHLDKQDGNAAGQQAATLEAAQYVANQVQATPEQSLSS
jgi:hypothetical protein